jgi:hypothetical protein
VNVQDAIVDTYEMLGEPSDLNPYSSGTFDVSSDGAQKILGWLNRAYRVIATWRYGNGTYARFPAFHKELFFQSQVVSGTAAGGGNTTITLATGAGDDRYNGWLVKITSGTGSGQVRMIVDYDGSGFQATVHKAWDTNPDATSEYELYSRTMKFLDSSETNVGEHIALDPKDEIYTVLKVTDLTNLRNIPQGGRTYNYEQYLLSSGRPESYIWQSNSIIWNVASDEERWYRLEYLRTPADLSAADDEFEIPEPFANAIWMWAVWFGLKRNQEPDQAYAMRRDLEGLMDRARKTEEAMLDRSEAFMMPVSGGR